MDGGCGAVWLAASGPGWGRGWWWWGATRFSLTAGAHPLAQQEMRPPPSGKWVKKVAACLPYKPTSLQLMCVC